MVDYDAAVHAVEDPDADPVLLARIAYENPEFGANVAAHRRAYPGLLRWIAEFGDDRAKLIAQERGYTRVSAGAGTGAGSDAGSGKSDGSAVTPEVESPAIPIAATSPAISTPSTSSAAAAAPVSVSVSADSPRSVLAASAGVSASARPTTAPTQDSLHNVRAISSAQPAATAQPAAAQPISVQPAASQPAAAQPVSVQPAAAQPAAAQVQSAAARQPKATNPYGFTVAQALDPKTDLLTIAQIAQYAPELRVYIAQNPSTYPELLTWLSELHDPEIDAALAAR